MINVKIGDRVRCTNPPQWLFGDMKVLEVNQDRALCVYRTCDRDPKGDKRVSDLITQQSWFLIDELTVITV
jgi:hypothetical protein